MEVRIDSIQIGDRVRKDLGELAGLAESMKRHGLLHPVVIKRDRTLIAGHRRIEAARLLGWADIAVTMIDVDDLLSAERDENAERKDFTPAEAVAIGRLIEEQEKPKADERRRLSGVRTAAIHANKRGDGNLPIPVIQKGNVREIAARAVGLSGTTYGRAKEVVGAAENNPESFGDLPALMENRTIETAYQELKRRKTGQGRGNPALRKMATLKPNREIERATVALEGICHILKELKVSELDPEKREGWANSLRKSAGVIKSTARRIYGR